MKSGNLCQLVFELIKERNVTVDQLVTLCKNRVKPLRYKCDPWPIMHTEDWH